MGKVKTKWIEDGAITFDKLNPSIFGSGSNQIPIGTHTHEGSGGGDPVSFYSNILINGDFNVSQRKTSDDSLDNREYPMDCWFYRRAHAARHSYEKSTDTPTIEESGHKSNYSLKLEVVTADTNIDNNDYSFIAQPIEGQKYSEYVGLDMVLSFLVKSSLPGTYCVAFTNMTDKSCVVEYDILAANTWELKAISVPLNYSGGTWNTTNGLGLLIVFTLAGGPLYQTPNVGTWEDGYYFSSANQINSTQVVGNTFQLSQVQFKQGTVVTAYSGVHFPTEVSLCQRYYEKTYSHDIIPGTNSTEGVIPLPRSTTKVSSWSFPYKVEKRVLPTITFRDITGILSCLSGVQDTGAQIDGLDITDTGDWKSFDIFIGKTGTLINYEANNKKLYTFYFHYELEAYIIS